MVRATQTEIEEAVEALRAGDLVVFPTETVYGVGANASNPAAVRKIFEVKGRPPDHPVIVHLDNPRYLHRWVSSMPPVAEQLAATSFEFEALPLELREAGRGGLGRIHALPLNTRVDDERHRGSPGFQLSLDRRVP